MVVAINFLKSFIFSFIYKYSNFKNLSKSKSNGVIFLKSSLPPSMSMLSLWRPLIRIQTLWCGSNRPSASINVILNGGLAYQYSVKNCKQLHRFFCSWIPSSKMATQYVGKMFDGQMHGLGKLIYDNEEYYNGEFLRGEKICYWISQVTRILISFTTQREKAWPRRVCLLRRLNFQGYELHWWMWMSNIRRHGK